MVKECIKDFTNFKLDDLKTTNNILNTLKVGLFIIIFGIIYIIIIGNQFKWNFKTENFMSNIINILIRCITTGFFEEMIFRGIFLNILLKNGVNNNKGIIKSIIVSSIVFAICHCININKDNIIKVIYQIFGSFIGGLYFGAIYVRTRNWIGLGLLHAFHNFFLMFYMLFTGDITNNTIIVETINNFGFISKIIFNDIIFIIPTIYILIKINYKSSR